LESENESLRKKLELQNEKTEQLRVKNVDISEKFSVAVKHWKSAEKEYNSEIETLSNQITTTYFDLNRVQSDLSKERRVKETYGLCANSLSNELEQFKNKQEMMEYLIEHLKMERTRSDENSSRLRTIYRAFPTTDSLCRILYGQVPSGESAGLFYPSSNVKLPFSLISSNSIKEGFLTKKAKEGSSWTIRYFIIKDNFLFYCNF
jgi:chromosome segregation ATPase